MYQNGVEDLDIDDMLLDVDDLLDIDKLTKDILSANGDADTSLRTGAECPAKLSQLQLEISKLNETVHILNKQIDSCKALREQIFFRQYVQSVVKRFRNLAQQVS